MSREVSLGRRHQHLSPPPPQYDPYAPQLGYLSESVHRLLTERECAIFDRGLADYHRRRNVKAFVECLSLVLNSNQKRQLLLPIRDTYVKPSDISRFNQLVQTYGLAASLKRRKKEEEKEKESGGVHKLEVKRDADGEWGFDIRGGSEHGLGIFVSWVEPGSSALKNGLQIGDQILKVNETNFESISHYEAVQLMKNSKKLRLWVLSHGRVPGSRMAHKAYRWIDTAGRPTTPPPDPFDIMEQRAKGGYKVLSEADERKLTLMVDSGRELGISIRGGAEHGLGIYISQVEDGSVGEAHGLKRGDQILDVNGVNFINIVHADAAKALSAQPCMVMKVKDVGKLPHSRITTYGQTQWYQSPSASSTMNRAGQNQPDGSPAFIRGAGTQVMLKQERSTLGRGMMNEVAQSVLTPQELSTLSYYIEQYEQQGLPVEDLITPLMDLLNTPEKLQLLSEVRNVIQARDLNRFNELTVHTELAAKKASKRAGSQERLSPHKGLQFQEQQEARDILTNFAMQSPGSGTQTMAQVHQEGGIAARPQLSPPTSANLSLRSGERTLTPGAIANGTGDSSSEDGERDRVPQKLSPQRTKAGTPVFHAPPPPSSPPQVHTSTPTGANSPDPKTVLTNTLKERRQWMRPGAKERSADETWDGQWTDASISSIQSPPGLAERHGGLEEVDSPSLAQVEERVRKETEARLRREFEERERRAAEEQQRKREEEEERKEQTLRAEREAMEKRIREMEKRTKQELEPKIRREAEEELQQQLEERERELEEERERREAEEQQRRKQEERETLQKHMRKIEERTKQELEEKIWKEAEVHIRQELEERMQQDRDQLLQQAAQAKQLDEQSIQEMEDRIRREAEEKYRLEFEQKIKKERQKQEEAERRRQKQEEKAKREAEVARMEAEEQARIELEETIRREAEAKAKEEYEDKLQRETEHRARLAKEIEVQKAAGERRQQDRREWERDTPRRRGMARGKQAAGARVRELNVQPQESEPPKEIEPPHVQKRDPQKESQEQMFLDAQRRQREAEEAEEQQREEEERQAQEEERKRKVTEKKKREELARKREENIRRREEEKKQKEAEQKRKREAVRRRKEEDEPQQAQQEQEQEHKEEQERQRALEAENRRREAEQRQAREAERRAGFKVQYVKVKEGDKGKKKEKSRGQIIEEERQRAEEKLKRRLEKEKARKSQEEPKADDETAEEKEEAAANAGPVGVVLREGKSFAGYSNLKGQLFRINITKVCKKLGIAIDGGANTKQKAVIIREITPEGCAAQTGEGLCIGQQILQVSGTSLAGLKHKEVVMTIKNAFEGPLNKTLELVVLDPDDPVE